jgi:hypothetical protein
MAKHALDRLPDAHSPAAVGAQAVVCDPGDSGGAKDDLHLLARVTKSSSICALFETKGTIRSLWTHGGAPRLVVRTKQHRCWLGLSGWRTHWYKAKIKREHTSNWRPGFELLCFSSILPHRTIVHCNAQ